MNGPRPLDGVRVLDLSRVFAGPVAGRVLADLGADVVKVEPPEGDITRLWGSKAAGQSTYFVQQNAGKRNICVDLRAEGGPELVADLAAEADIVLENFRPGVLARYGLDYEHLAARNPGLVMASISGFGQDGPESQRMAYAPIVHAETGHLRHTEGEVSGDMSFSAADVLSGLHGVIAVQAALRTRDQSGIGQHIDMAMIDAMTYSADIILNALDGGRRAESLNGEAWPTADGPKMLTGGLRWIWHQLSNTAGLSDPTPADADVSEKIASRRAIIEDHLCSLPDRAAVITTLDKANLAWADIRECGEVLESPTLIHRETVAEIDNRDGGTRKVIRNPYRMSATDYSEIGVAAFRGEHNAAVMSEWLGEDDLSSYSALDHDEWVDGSGTDE